MVSNILVHFDFDGKTSIFIEVVWMNISFWRLYSKLINRIIYRDLVVENCRFYHLMDNPTQLHPIEEATMAVQLVRIGEVEFNPHVNMT